jgi:hypothetical protein
VSGRWGFLHSFLLTPWYSLIISTSLKFCLWDFAIKRNIQLKRNPLLQENASLSLNYSPKRGKHRYCITKDDVPFCKTEKDAQSDWVPLIFFHGARAPHWVWVSSLSILYDHTQVDTPHSVRLLWTSDQSNAETSSWQHKTYNRQTCMSLVEFKPTKSAGEQLQNYASDHAATGIGKSTR